MYLFNTTFYVDDTVMSEWKEWLQTTYFPLMQAGGTFSNPLVYRVHSLQDEDGSSSIAVQFSVQTMEDIRQWEVETNARIEQSVLRIFGTKVLHFWTVLEPLL